MTCALRAMGLGLGRLGKSNEGIGEGNGSAVIALIQERTTRAEPDPVTMTPRAG